MVWIHESVANVQGSGKNKSILKTKSGELETVRRFEF
jgi:hypothetical protein